MKIPKDLAVIALGFELAGFVLVSLLIGQYLDKIFHTQGIIVIVLCLFSLIFWMYRIVVFTKKRDEGNKK